MARTWASVNVPLSDVPRCPDVPNDTGPEGERRYAASRLSRAASCAASGRVPAEGLTRRTMAPLPVRVRCYAAADEPRRSVPRAGERAPDRARRQPRDRRPLDGARRFLCLPRGDAAAGGARAPAAAAALAA